MLEDEMNTANAAYARAVARASAFLFSLVCDS
jgi:hypothetical protein